MSLPARSPKLLSARATHLNTVYRKKSSDGLPHEDMWASSSGSEDEEGNRGMRPRGLTALINGTGSPVDRVLLPPSSPTGGRPGTNQSGNRPTTGHSAISSSVDSPPQSADHLSSLAGFGGGRGGGYGGGGGNDAGSPSPRARRAGGMSRLSSDLALALVERVAVPATFADLLALLPTSPPWLEGLRLRQTGRTMVLVDHGRADHGDTHAERRVLQFVSPQVSGRCGVAAP